jgi:hypothetical protein
MSLSFRYKLQPVGHPVVGLGGRHVRPRPIIPITVVGPAGSHALDALVDSGADDTIFPEGLAVRLGIDLTNAPHGTGTGVALGVVELRYAEVTLRIADNQEQREWRGCVGFTASKLRRPLLGFAGCLQFFTTELQGDREEVKLTVNSLYPGT